MSTTVFNVANHILKSNKGFDLLQLIKLCYLTYGWYLAWHDKCLFEQKVEAWKYGPVIPELYYALRHYRDEPLPANCLESLVREGKDKFRLSEEMKELIDAVVDYYGECSGITLSALTHQKGSPWEKTYTGTGKTWISIPDHLIKAHFDELKRISQEKNE